MPVMDIERQQAALFFRHPLPPIPQPHKLGISLIQRLRQIGHQSAGFAIRQAGLAITDRLAHRHHRKRHRLEPVSGRQGYHRPFAAGCQQLTG